MTTTQVSQFAFVRSVGANGLAIASARTMFRYQVDAQCLSCGGPIVTGEFGGIDYTGECIGCGANSNETRTCEQ